MEIDRLIDAKWILPIEPANVVLENHALAIQSGKIIDILPSAQARSTYSARALDVLPDHVLTPGLINLHTHAAMNLMRGVGDDLPLMRWLKDRIWPIEQSLLSPEFVRAGTRLACLEMLRGGTTCFNDMYFFPDAAAQAALEVGMRASLGVTVIDFPTPWGSDANDYIDRGLALRDGLLDQPTISFTLAPHSPYTIKDETFERIAMLAEQLDMPIHCHIHETIDEIHESERTYGVRPIERLNRLGIIGPRLISVHSVHLTPTEIALFAKLGVTIAHCPTSNLKLGSGIAPIAACLDAGVRIGLGTDGAASNNRLDLLAEMRLAALLAKGTSGRADHFDAHRVLRAATLEAACALGLDRQIGSLELGKEADLVAFNLASLETQPCFDPISHLIYVASREHVTDVWVRGEPVAQKRQFTKTGARTAEDEGATALSLWQNRMMIRLDSLH